MRANERGRPGWSVGEARQLEDRLVFLRRVAVSQRVQIRVRGAKFVDWNAAGICRLNKSQRPALACVELFPRGCFEPRSICGGQNVIELAIVWHGRVAILKPGDNRSHEFGPQQWNIARSDEGGFALIFQFCEPGCDSRERAERVVLVAGDLNRLGQCWQFLIESRDRDNWCDGLSSGCGNPRKGNRQATSQPGRYSLRMYFAASFAFFASSFSASHSRALPIR